MRCSSFCTADSYKLPAVSNYFKTNGYAVKAYRKVFHVIPPNKKADIFIFGYGCIVTWGLKRTEEQELLRQMKEFSINLLPNIERDFFIYRKGEQTEMVTHERFNADIIILESDSAQLKLAISHGLAQSIQLESYEAAVQKTIEENAHYPQVLAKRGTIPLSQKNISKRMGAIFIARSSINLNSEYLADPEYVWEYPSVETYYIMSKKFLDIPRRVAVLNQKLDVLHELFGMLTSQLQHKHANLLETIIILLIFFEIAITLVWK
jgi:uncharacterized Rmd1/YagE family protein